MDAELLAHCTELLAPLGPVHSRRMFGGHGFYVDGLFMALIAYEQLWLKADAETRARFEAAGCEPFTYETKDGVKGSMSYYRAPEEAMESPALMLPWARLAFESALRAQAAKAVKTVRRPATKKTTPAKKTRSAATKR